MRTGLVVVVVFVVIAALPACGQCGSGSGSSSSSSSSSSASTAPSSSAPKQNYQVTLRGHGAAGKIFKAVLALALNDEQKTSLDTIGSELQKGGASTPLGPDGGLEAELRSIHAELLAGVKANKVDIAKIESLSAASHAAHKARLARETTALNQVQRLLTPQQRSGVAATVRAAEGRHTPRVKPHPRRDAGPPIDAGVIRKPDGGFATPAKPSNAPINWTRMRLESYTKDIGLDAEQTKKVDALLEKAGAEPATDAHEDRAAAIEALVAAFEKEGFDANHHAVPEVQDRRAALMSLVRYIADVVPLLRPEQNQKLATKLIEPEAHKPHHGPLINAPVGQPTPRPPDDDEE